MLNTAALMLMSLCRLIPTPRPVSSSSQGLERDKSIRCPSPICSALLLLAPPPALVSIFSPSTALATPSPTNKSIFSGYAPFSPKCPIPLDSFICTSHNPSSSIPLRHLFLKLAFCPVSPKFPVIYLTIKLSVRTRTHRSKIVMTSMISVRIVSSLVVMWSAFSIEEVGRMLEVGAKL